jgi:hypothetical protein
MHWPKKRNWRLAKSRRNPAMNFPRKNTTEHLDREKEVGTRSDPPGVIWRETTSGNHEVDVRMRGEGLSPRVQNRKKAQLGAELLRVGSHIE